MALTTQQMLDAARTAYHQLQTGEKAEEVVDQNGERVRFTRANADRLLAYINRLEAQVAAGASTQEHPKAIGVFF